MQMWAEEFLQAGYRVRVITPEPRPTDPFYQEQLQAPEGVSCVRLPVFDPSRIVRRRGQNSAGSAGAGGARGVALKIRDLLKLPDHRRLWNRRVVRMLANDAPGILLTTSPYDSTHLIGHAVKARVPELFWVADFRDSWDHRRWIDGPVSRFHSWYNDRLERRVMQSADLLTWFHDIGIEFAGERVGAWVAEKSLAVRNGVDRQTRARLEARRREVEGPPRFVHAGTLWSFRFPPGFPDVWLRFVADVLPQAELHFYGPIEPDVQHQLDELAARCPAPVVFHGTVPRETVLDAIASCTAQFVWSSPAREAITSKMYEAVAAQRPILFCGHPQGSGATFLRNLGASASVAEAFSEAALERQLRAFAQASRAGTVRSFVPRLDLDEIATERQIARLIERLPPANG
ncbi:MAG: hypothetical protein D6761_12125 [Candidatus Dadabacteria bacterium]|nr:MAG: hypothetical protein D6761_12125 [Candidatus Dadabacteria bacterium]